MKKGIFILLLALHAFGASATPEDEKWVNEQLPKVVFTLTPTRSAFIFNWVKSGLHVTPLRQGDSRDYHDMLLKILDGFKELQARDLVLVAKDVTFHSRVLPTRSGVMPRSYLKRLRRGVAEKSPRKEELALYPMTPKQEVFMSEDVCEVLTYLDVQSRYEPETRQWVPRYAVGSLEAQTAAEIDRMLEMFLTFDNALEKHTAEVRAYLVWRIPTIVTFAKNRPVTIDAQSAIRSEVNRYILLMLGQYRIK